MGEKYKTFQSYLKGRKGVGIGKEISVEKFFKYERKTETLEDYRDYPYDLEVEKKFVK